MKKRMICLVFYFSAFACMGQEREFNIYPNGLIYSDITMKQLGLIVDSLNLKFKTCELSKIYYAKSQAKAHYIQLSKAKTKEARRDMESNISFEAFLKKYPQSEVEKDLLVVKHLYKDYSDKDVVVFNSITLNSDIDYSVTIDKDKEMYNRAVIGTWIYDYSEKTSYSDESISGFYFITEFQKQPLPEAYARMVQYADCMIDTSSQIFKDDAMRTGVRYNDKQPSKVAKFIDYVHKETKRPIYDTKGDEEAYWKAYNTWDSLRLLRIDSFLVGREPFQSLLSEAIVEALEKGMSDDEFEEYVGRYDSKKTVLELKRGRIVVGGCSMDTRPRQHAMNIAVLSAETVNWDIFLRAHLDIMNDRFERASDGSYAWGARQTYIRELEELEINVADLLLGISFRIENPSQNHYYGSIGRLGRALAETKYANELESKMLAMVKDHSLDDYNRILIYYLYLNYIHNIDDKDRKASNKAALLEAVAALPDYIKVNFKKE